MKNGTDQQGMTDPLSMIATLQRSLGGDQQIRDIPDLPFAAANHQQGL
jgi:hypothetical protein